MKHLEYIFRTGDLTNCVGVHNWKKPSSKKFRTSYTTITSQPTDELTRTKQLSDSQDMSEMDRTSQDLDAV